MIDVIILCIFLFMVTSGYKKGFIWQVLNLARMIIVLVLIYLFMNQITVRIAPFVQPWIENIFLQNIAFEVRSQVSFFIVRLILPIGLIVLVRFVTAQMLRLFHGRIIKTIPIVGMVNAILGSAVALLEFMLLLLIFIALMPLAGSQWNMYLMEQSLVIRFAQANLPSLIQLLQMYWS